MPRKIFRDVGYGYPFVGSCIACGGQTLLTQRTDVVFLEKDEWKHFTNPPKFEGEEPDMPPSTLVKAKDIESMYIDADDWMWTTFYRAIIHRQDINHLGVSGITQGFMEFNLAPVPQVPRDPQKARIGDPYNNPVRSACTRFEQANMFHPNAQKELKQVGYAVHAHCWLLVDRVIGIKLVDAHLAIFVKAVNQFWIENTDIYMIPPVDSRDDNTTIMLRNLQNFEVKLDPPSSMWKNPAIVPEIQSIIENSTRVPGSQRMQPSMLSKIPLEIVIQITHTVKQASISDARNLLTAFGWRLPDSYWKTRSWMDLIFEYDDIKKTGHPVDWQFLGLATEELLRDSDRYDRSGLKTRRRVFQYLGQIKSIFLNLVKEDERDHVFRRRISQRKNFL